MCNKIHRLTVLCSHCLTYNYNSIHGTSQIEKRQIIIIIQKATENSRVTFDVNSRRDGQSNFRKQHESL